MGAEFQVGSLEEMCDLMCNNKVPTLKLEPLSIEETIRQLKKCKSFHNGSYGEALNMAIKALEEKPFINKPCVSEKVCEHDKNVVIDKIRAEIEEMTPTYHNPDWSITDLVPISEVLKLIDKYKAESED